MRDKRVRLTAEFRVSFREITPETVAEMNPSRGLEEVRRDPLTMRDVARQGRLLRALLRWRNEKNRALYDWAMRIAARRGRGRACVALARKLAGILYAMWRDGTEFDPQAIKRGVDEAPAAAA